MPLIPLSLLLTQQCLKFNFPRHTARSFRLSVDLILANFALIERLLRLLHSQDVRRSKQKMLAVTIDRQLYLVPRDTYTGSQLSTCGPFERGDTQNIQNLLQHTEPACCCCPLCSTHIDGRILQGSGLVMNIICVRQNSVISILLYNKSILHYYRPIIPYYR